MRGVIGSPQRFTDFAQTFVLKIPEQDRAAVGFVERGHRFVQQGFDALPNGFISTLCKVWNWVLSIHGIHFHGDLFAQLAARFFVDHVNGRPARDRIKPRGQNGVGFQSFRAAREVGKDGLRNFLGQLPRAHLPQRGGKHQVHMAVHQRGEGILRLVAGKLPEQIKVMRGHVQKHIAAGPGNPTKNHQISEG